MTASHLKTVAGSTPETLCILNVRHAMGGDQHNRGV